MGSAFLHFYSICKNWVKAMVLRLLHRTSHEVEEEPDPAPGVLTDLDKKLGRMIQKRQAQGKPVDTRKGGPNMPKYQPCPKCRRMSKRAEKTAGGANYECPEHGKFFTRAPGL